MPKPVRRSGARRDGYILIGLPECTASWSVERRSPETADLRERCAQPATSNAQWPTEALSHIRRAATPYPFDCLYDSECG